MKYFCLFFLLIAANRLLSQTPFEGKVRYTVTAADKPTNATLTIYFAKPGIRLEIVEENKWDKEPETLIINLDSGKIFNLMTREKKYKETILKKQMAPKELIGKTIAGYATQAVNPDFSGIPTDMKSLFGNTILYTSNDLRYAIPTEYKACPELIMIHNGRIVLGGDFFFADDAYPDLNKDTTKERDVLFRVLANEVMPQKLSDSLFLFPAGYEKWTYNYNIDSTTFDTDTAIITPAKPPAKNKKKQPKKKTSTTKQTTTRRKND